MASIPASCSRLASGRLSTRKLTSKLGSSTASSDRMTSSSWQIAKTRMSEAPDGHGQTIIIRRGTILRSEEHTSELQSRLHLVCRLLLEKKKKKTKKQK